jgi:hypothetical protein
MKQLTQTEILSITGGGEPDSGHIIMAGITGIVIGAAIGASLSFRGTHLFVMSTLAMGGFVVVSLTEEHAMIFGPGLLAMDSAAITANLGVRLSSLL